MGWVGCGVVGVGGGWWGWGLWVVGVVGGGGGGGVVVMEERLLHTYNLHDGEYLLALYIRMKRDA